MARWGWSGFPLHHISLPGVNHSMPLPVLAPHCGPVCCTQTQLLTPILSPLTSLSSAN